MSWTDPPDPTEASCWVQKVGAKLQFVDNPGEIGSGSVVWEPGTYSVPINLREECLLYSYGRYQTWSVWGQDATAVQLQGHKRKWTKEGNICCGTKNICPQTWKFLAWFHKVQSLKLPLQKTNRRASVVQSCAVNGSGLQKESKTCILFSNEKMWKGMGCVLCTAFSSASAACFITFMCMAN